MSDTEGLRRIEGGFGAPGDVQVAIVAARFNDFIVEKLIDGAIDGLTRHGLPRSAITLVRVPGAYELPLVLRRLAKTGKFAAVIALGAVIRGSTPHFDYVCSAASNGCTSAMAETRRGSLRSR